MENPLNDFAKGMIEYRLTRDPLAREIILIKTKKVRDQYQDSKVQEQFRIKKLAKVKKDPDMYYVQELTGELLQDSDSIPWLISLTTVVPKNSTVLQKEITMTMDDMVLLNGIKYSISLVKPKNRKLQGLQEILIYPERTHWTDPLRVYYTTLFELNSDILIEDPTIDKLRGKSVILDIVYGGNPLEMSFDGTTWVKFCSRVKFSIDEIVNEGSSNTDSKVKLYLRDKETTIEYDIPIRS